MHDVDRISLSVTFADGSRRRIHLNPDELSYFQSEVIAELFDLTDCPRDLSSVGLPALGAEEN